MNAQPARPNPYVGPRAFQTGEALYGRDGDILNLYYLLLSERVVLLFSPSGAGKSSLIQAGLIPRLKEKFSFIPIIRVNQEIPESLAQIKGINRYVLSAIFSMEEAAPEDQRLPAEQLARMSLSEYLDQRVRPKQPEAENVKPIFAALIFDQFEEILTTAPNDEEAKKIFFDQLGEALFDNRSWALFSARQDYAAAFEPYLRTIPTRFSNRYRLDLLDAEKALQAIQMPALDMRVDFSDSAAQKLIDDLRRVQTQRPDGSTQMELGRYVEPVQLQVVCYRLWNNLSAQETAITEQHIASIGSVNESLSAYYADQVSQAKEKFKVPERVIREWFNHQLITKQGLRSQVMLEPGKSGGLDNPVIRFLESAHLLRAEKRAGSTWFELSHDRLIEPIRTDNEQWLTSHLSLLQQQAKLWNQQERPASLLLREKELARARSWAADEETELLPYEKEFLSACKEEERRALRLIRRNQAITILGVAAMILAVLAFWAYRQADAQRQIAQRQARATRAGQLAAQAQTTLAEFPQRSLLLALEALNVTSDAGETRQPSAEEALRAALDQPHGLPLAYHTKAVTVVAFSPDGRWLASGSPDQTIDLWDMRTTPPNAKPIRLDGSGTEIRVMSFSPDGRWLAAAGDNKNALLWNLARAGPAPIQLAGHSANINALAFSPDGRWLATGSVDETIRLWDLQAPDPAGQPRILSGHQGEISVLAFDPSGQWLASGSLDATARLWKVAAPEAAPLVLEGHQRNVSVLAFSPDGRWLATGSFDHTARLWDLKGGSPSDHAVVLAGHSDVLTALAFSPDNRWLATASLDHTARLWKINSPDPPVNPFVLRGHADAVNTLAFSRDGRWLATGSSDHSLRLWDFKAPDPAADPGILHGHDDGVFTLAFSPDGLWLASGGADGSTRLWNMRAPFPTESPGILRGHSDSVNRVAFSPNGRWLSASSLDGSTLLWDLTPASLPADPLILRKSDAPVLASSFSPSGHWLASGGGDSSVWLWNLDDANPANDPLELRGNQNPVSAVEFSPGVPAEPVEHWLASGSQDGSIHIWDLQAQDPNAAARELGIDANHPVVAMAFSPDARWLAAASGFTLWLWDMNKPEAAPLVLRKHADRVTSLAFSPDGRWLATGSMDKTAQVWKMDSSGPGSEPLTLAGHDDWVNILAFSSDSRWLATGSQDHTARLWNLRSENPAAHALVLRGHDGSIGALAFSPDGNWLATGSDDGTARLWNLHAANPSSDSVVLSGQEGSITSLSFNANSQLATGSSDHTVKLWMLSLDELKQQACQSAGRNLTSKEWAQYFPGRAYQATCNQWPSTP